jgi:hypothetical protein
MGNRRGITTNLVSVSIGEPTPEKELRKQSTWDKAPWQPGEIPATPLMRVLRPLDRPPRDVWGSRDLGVELPTARGRGARRLARGGTSDKRDSAGYDSLGDGNKQYERK